MSFWQATVYTLFPDAFPGPLDVSIVGKAHQEGGWNLKTINIRDFAIDRHKTVDDAPYGGGAGMVLRPDVVDAALRAHSDPQEKRVYLSPRGHLFSQNYAKHLAKEKKVAILCGRFEGVDQRILDHWGFEEVSLGDFILCGGEVAAMAMIEATVRLLPGVVGTAASLQEESLQNDLLEYGHYTRPAEWEGHAVPEVLLSGNHAAINKWRHEESCRLTSARRPDLWRKFLETEGK